LAHQLELELIQFHMAQKPVLRAHQGVQEGSGTRSTFSNCYFGQVLCLWACVTALGAGLRHDEVEVLSRSSGRSDERSLSRAVQRVKAGTHTPMEAATAEPSLNAHFGAERESYFRKIRRHVAQL